MALTEPDFIERDADKITAEMIAQYEAATGKTLYPAQAERLLIDLWAYREMLVRVAAQEAAKQNLVAFAREPMIDYLGELVGVYRLAAQPASIPLQFSVEEEQAIDVLIPAGTRVSASDSIIFSTDTDVVLKAGLLLVNTTATCTEPGVAGNGWQPAQVSQLLDEIDNVDLQVTNLAASSGGSEQEDNDRLRERIKLAPESFTNAGSRKAYRFHAMQAHPNIVDVAVLSRFRAQLSCIRYSVPACRTTASSHWLRVSAQMRKSGRSLIPCGLKRLSRWITPSKPTSRSTVTRMPTR